MVKNNKQLYRSNATARKTRLHKTLKSFSNDDSDGSENGKNAIGLVWQNNNFTRAPRLRHENAYFHAL